MRRPQIALLTPLIPADEGNGLAMRAALFAEGLSRAGLVRVLVVPVFGVGIDPRGLVAPVESIEILTVDLDPDPVADLTARLATSEGRATASAVHPRPALCRPATLAAAQVVADRVSGADLIVVFRLYLAPFLDLLLDRAGRPAVWIDVDDVESTTRQLLDQPAEAERFARLEGHYLPRCDLVSAASVDDADALRDRYHLPAVTAIPNAVRLPTLAGGGPAAPDVDLLFVGNLSYPPNVQGARWLAEEVVPRLGAVRVAIVGSGPGPELEALGADPRITVAGDVDSVGPWYAATKVVVVPLLTGGGTRTKLMEALVHHRPVVSTSLGAAGLPIASASLLVADGPDEFASACQRLLDDRALAERMATVGEHEALRTSTVAVVGAKIGELATHILSS